MSAYFAFGVLYLTTLQFHLFKLFPNDLGDISIHHFSANVKHQYECLPLYVHMRKLLSGSLRWKYEIICNVGVLYATSKYNEV